jgi:VIT1/CCC1 family predicted Fe2+/Mn2+ transporter
MAFPDVNINELPADRFAKFIRVEAPVPDTYEVYEGVTYQWVDGVVKDVHSFRQMTDEERAAKEVEIAAAQAEAPAASKATLINDFPKQN